MVLYIICEREQIFCAGLRLRSTVICDRARTLVVVIVSQSALTGSVCISAGRLYLRLRLHPELSAAAGMPVSVPA